MASLTPEAVAIYQHLIKNVVPKGKVVTYKELSDATNVPIGVNGGHIGQVLGAVAVACEAQGLPPLTAVVVRGEELYDPTRRHGMPGVGYFTQRASTDPAFANWETGPAGFDRETARWSLRDTVEAHQNAVWKHSAWPAKL